MAIKTINNIDLERIKIPVIWVFPNQFQSNEVV